MQMLKLHPKKETARSENLRWQPSKRRSEMSLNERKDPKKKKKNNNMQRNYTDDKAWRKKNRQDGGEDNKGGAQTYGTQFIGSRHMKAECGTEEGAHTDADV